MKNTAIEIHVLQLFLLILLIVTACNKKESEIQTDVIKDLRTEIKSERSVKQNTYGNPQGAVVSRFFNCIKINRFNVDKLSDYGKRGNLMWLACWEILEYRILSPDFLKFKRPENNVFIVFVKSIHNNDEDKSDYYVKVDLIEKKWKVTDATSVCSINLNHILQAIRDYKNKDKNHRPYPVSKNEDFLRDLVLSGAVTNKNHLICATDERCKSDDIYFDYEAIDNREGVKCNIDSLRKKGIEDHKIPIIWDKKGNHGNVRHVLFLHGHITSLNEDEFQKSISIFK